MRQYWVNSFLWCCDSDDGDTGQAHLRYKCHTFKKLSMQRAFLTAKDGETTAAAAVAEASVDDSAAEQEPSAVDVGGDELHDVSSTSCMDTDTAPQQHNTTEITVEDANQQRHASDVMLESGAVTEEDVGAPRSSEGNVSMEES